MRIIFMLFGILIIISCSDVQLENHYYKSGEIQSTIELNNSGKRDGVFTEYFRNGKIKTISKYYDGRLIDTIKGFYSSGNIEFIQFKSDKVDSCYTFFKTGELLSKGEIMDKKVYGWWKFYDKKGGLKYKKEYKFIKDSIIQNQLVTYRFNKEIVKDSSWYVTYEIPDNIYIGKIYPIKLIMHSKSFDESSVYFYYGKSLTKEFDNINNIKIDTLFSYKDTVKTKIRFTKLGKRDIRGFFQEKHIEIAGVNKLDSNKVDLVTHSNTIYVDIPVYVKDTIK